MQPDFRNLVETSRPVAEPVDLATAKKQLRVTIDADDDLISAQIVAARELVEKELRRTLVARTWALSFDAFLPDPRGLLMGPFVQERPYFPIWGTIRVPRPPLVSVQSIAYLDLGGNPAVLDPASYTVVAGGRAQGCVSPAYGLSWPQCRPQPGSVVISYTAGYGGPLDVPQAVKAAILLLVGNLYRFREPVTDVATLPIPFSVRALLSAHRWGSYV